MWMRVSGQILSTTRPTMSDPGMGPKNRLSWESDRLSPMTKYSLGGTFWVADARSVTRAGGEPRLVRGACR